MASDAIQKKVERILLLSPDPKKRIERAIESMVRLINHEEEVNHFILLFGEADIVTAVSLFQRAKSLGALQPKQIDDLTKQLELILKKRGQALRKSVEDARAEEDLKLPDGYTEQLASLITATLLLTGSEEACEKAVRHGMESYFRIMSDNRYYASHIENRVSELLQYNPDAIRLRCILVSALRKIMLEGSNRAVNNLFHSAQHVVPIVDLVPEELKKLILELIEAEDYRSLYLLQKVFPNVPLDTIGLTPETLADRIFACRNDNLFRGLLFLERKLIETEEDEHKAVRAFQTIVESRGDRNNPVWSDPLIGHEGWFRMYLLCRLIRTAPERTKAILTEMKVPDRIRFYRKTNEVQQEAMMSLFRSGCPDAVDFLKAIAKINVFRFDKDGEKAPYFEPHHEFRDPDMIRTLATCGHYTKEDVIFLYMNSYLRCSCPVRFLMETLYEKELEGDARRFSIAEDFKNYPFLGKLTEGRSPDEPKTMRLFQIDSNEKARFGIVREGEMAEITDRHHKQIFRCRFDSIATYNHWPRVRVL